MAAKAEIAAAAAEAAAAEAKAATAKAELAARPKPVPVLPLGACRFHDKLKIQIEHIKGAQKSTQMHTPYARTHARTRARRAHEHAHAQRQYKVLYTYAVCLLRFCFEFFTFFFCHSHNAYASRVLLLTSPFFFFHQILFRIVAECLMSFVDSLSTELEFPMVAVSIIAKIPEHQKVRECCYTSECI